MEFLGGVASTLIIGGVFYALGTRGLRREVANLRQDNVSLRQEMATLPSRLIEALTGHGIIPQNREPEARSFVAERFPRWLEALAETLPKGFKFQPTDVSGKQVLGPTDFGSTRVERKD